jgi:hypothetical protein
MRPLLPFYGSKWRDAKRYQPTHTGFVEPCAGPAGYSKYDPFRDVLREHCTALHSRFAWTVSLGTQVLVMTNSQQEAMSAANALAETHRRPLWLREPGTNDRQHFQ